jgi:hypothetical protein
MKVRIPEPPWQGLPQAVFAEHSVGSSIVLFWLAGNDSVIINSLTSFKSIC